MRIRTPRTRQVNRFRFGCCCEAAVPEYISVFFAFVGGRGGYISIAYAVYLAVAEYGGRPSEDEIDSTFYVAILIILTALFAISVERILIANEAAMLEIYTVAFNKASYCLATLPAVLAKVMFSA